MIRESSPEATNQPGFVNMGKFTIAESMIVDREQSHDSSPSNLSRASALLDSIDPASVAQMPSLEDFPATMELARARLAVLRHDMAAAKLHLLKAEPAAVKPGFDPYEKRAFDQVRAALRN